MKQKFNVKGSKIEGKGVFAVAPFKKGETICVFGGERISIPELKRRYKEGKERISDPLQISERQYLDVDKPFVYVNHSCEPCAGFVKTCTLIALRDIKIGEEITFDYSATEWTWEHFGENMEWEMKCVCGSKTCRGTVTQFPFLPKKIMRQYVKSGIVQDFIMRKIKKSEAKSGF